MAFFGRTSLVLGLVSAMGAAYLLISGSLRHDQRRLSAGRGAVYGLFVAISVAAGILWYAFATDNFVFQYVVDHSSRQLGLMYKLAALWSGQAGSLLFWLWLLVGYMVLVSRKVEPEAERLQPAALGILSMIAVFFAFLLTFVSTPFIVRGTPALDGRGLNPVLQDPVMTIHPVALYLGYVGMAVPYAYAMAALLLRRGGNHWIRVTRRWTLIAWIFLSAGMLLGANWAYYELGWGGYWGWDPVENSSLMPWLVGTAFLHSIMVQERRNMLKVWNMLLASVLLFLTLLGTFITRSGVLSSVHAFVESNISPWFIGFMGLVLSASLYLIVDRWDLLKDEAHVEVAFSKESSFLLNNYLLLGTAFAVFWGTIFPLISRLWGADITVGPPYFNRVAGPVLAALVVLMGICPLIAWRSASLQRFVHTFWLPAMAGSLVLLVLTITGMRSPGALAAFGAAAFVATAILYEIIRGAWAAARVTETGFLRSLLRMFNHNPRRYGGYVVHLAIVLVVVGVTGTQYFQFDKTTALLVGESMTAGPYELRLEGLSTRQQGDIKATAADLLVSKDGRPLGLLRPEKRTYANFPGQPTTEVAIYSTVLHDLYIILAGWDQFGARAGFRVFVNPLINWIWAGGYLLIFGAAFAMWPRGDAFRVRADRVFQELAELEHDYYMGKIDPDAYAADQEELKRRARRVLSRERQLDSQLSGEEERTHA